MHVLLQAGREQAVAVSEREATRHEIGSLQQPLQALGEARAELECISEVEKTNAPRLLAPSVSMLAVVGWPWSQV